MDFGLILFLISGGAIPPIAFQVTTKKSALQNWVTCVKEFNTTNKQDYGVRATTIEGQNALAKALCFA